MRTSFGRSDAVRSRSRHRHHDNVFGLSFRAAQNRPSGWGRSWWRSSRSRGSQFRYVAPSCARTSGDSPPTASLTRASIPGRIRVAGQGGKWRGHGPRLVSTRYCRTRELARHARCAERVSSRVSVCTAPSAGDGALCTGEDAPGGIVAACTRALRRAVTQVRGGRVSRISAMR